MADKKFTPGPWIRDRKSGVRCDVRAANGRKVALCWGLSTSKGAQTNSPEYRAECDANANLITAAPDMYQALEEVAVLGSGRCVIGKPLAEMIRAALNKARDEL